MDILGDLGGIMELIEVILGTLLLPLSEFMFNLDMINHLYKARTRDDKMFEKKNDECAHIDNKKLSRKTKREIRLHRNIRLSTYDQARLYLVKNCCGFLTCRWKNKDKLTKLYEEGCDGIDTRLDITAIIANLQLSYQFLNNCFLNDQIRTTLTHAHENIIDLEDSSDGGENSSTDKFSEESEGMTFDPRQIKQKLANQVKKTRTQTFKKFKELTEEKRTSVILKSMQG